MSKPDFDESQGDPAEMFDFLQDKPGSEPVRPEQRARRRRSFEMPIIRPPVPISESGPMRVDSSGTVNDREYPGHAQSHQSPGGPGNADWNEALYLDDAEPETSGIKKAAIILTSLLLMAGAVFAYLMYEKTGPKTAATAATVEGNQSDTAQLDTPGILSPDSESNPTEQTEPAVVTELPDVPESTANTQSTETVGTTERPNTLFNRFNEQLQLIEGLIAENKLDEAEQVIFTMDRAVYGYGASEFTGFEQLIASRRAANGGAPAGTALDASPNATDLAVTAENETAAVSPTVSEEQLLLEAQQLAEEQRLAEAKRILEEEQAVEQERLANEARATEAARQAEEQRLADEARIAEVARQAEEQRIAEQARAAELAQQNEVEAQRVAEEQRLAEQAEQERLAEAERVAAEQVAADLAAQQAQAAAESLALATAKAEDRIIEERVRLDREADADLARQEAQMQESERIRSEEALVIQPNAPQAQTDNGAIAITDEDFNFVASKFVELKTAVTNKDIDTVIALTKPSGKRIQQMLQIFENSASVQARVSNVATRNADGVIVGELKIQKLIKNSGAEATVPSNLSSIKLTSERGPEGWSAIDW